MITPSVDALSWQPCSGVVHDMMQKAPTEFKEGRLLARGWWTWKQEGEASRVGGHGNRKGKLQGLMDMETGRGASEKGHGNRKGSFKGWWTLKQEGEASRDWWTWKQEGEASGVDGHANGKGELLKKDMETEG